MSSQLDDLPWLLKVALDFVKHYLLNLLLMERIYCLSK